MYIVFLKEQNRLDPVFGQNGAMTDTFLVGLDWTMPLFRFSQRILEYTTQTVNPERLSIALERFKTFRSSTKKVVLVSDTWKEMAPMIEGIDEDLISVYRMDGLIEEEDENMLTPAYKSKLVNIHRICLR